MTWLPTVIELVVETVGTEVAGPAAVSVDAVVVARMTGGRMTWKRTCQ